MVSNHLAKPETEMLILSGNKLFTIFFPIFSASLFIRFSLFCCCFWCFCFRRRKWLSISNGHDSVEVLPVPIKWERDHWNER